jgi:hypothetical protein
MRQWYMRTPDMSCRTLKRTVSPLATLTVFPSDQRLRLDGAISLALDDLELRPVDMERMIHVSWIYDLPQFHLT